MTCMSDVAARRRNKAKRLAAYLNSHQPDLRYDVAAEATLVAEEEGLFTLYRVAVTASDGSLYRHLLVVPTNVSAASFDVGLALVEADSVDADAGRFDGVEQLASALKWDYRRYRIFPPPVELNRFCM